MVGIAKIRQFSSPTKAVPQRCPILGWGTSSITALQTKGGGNASLRQASWVLAQ